MHKLEALVGARQRQLERHVLVDFELAAGVEVDDRRQLRRTFDAAKRRAAPDAAGDELEGPRRNLGARRRDADDDALAPALVTLRRGASGLRC